MGRLDQLLGRILDPRLGRVRALYYIGIASHRVEVLAKLDGVTHLSAELGGTKDNI